MFINNIIPDSISVSAPDSVPEIIPAVNEVYALLDNSYRCGQNVSFSPVNATRGYSLVFQDLKVRNSYGSFRFLLEESRLG